MPRNPALHRLWNIALSLFLIVALLPLFILISVALRLTQGPEIFYRGIRLGRNGAPFYIYKFRTLKPAAAALSTPEGRSWGRSQLETPLGRYLRRSRLDELPQLFNVLKGDMNLMGPRPVRPQQAETFSHKLRDYDLRFSVTPGLVGYTQALMTHDTPKSIRNRFNAVLCRQKADLSAEIIFLTQTATAVAARTLVLAGERLGQMARGIRHERRQERRLRPRNAEVTILGGQQTASGRLIDINDEAFTFCSSTPLPPGIYQFRLKRSIRRGRIKSAKCEGILNDLKHPIRVGKHNAKVYPFRYIVHFRALSDAGRYIIDKHFLHNSVVR